MADIAVLQYPISRQSIMSHQVLARKWRPRSFQEVVGQTTVVQALSNALTQNRLHHAYLFTGTRGVGKTTIARLLAKCLNCSTGVTASPCGQCMPCQTIDQGRFLDLLEIDAASRTKVEDTRDLLDNVQYAPTQGRYKIYLIDEVHMLSNHSFNALLKTLEEPPPHVKFLLATTDPQRLPVTVLSRCLQFHLKNLSSEQISRQLAVILNNETIAYESPALLQLAHAAQGSMRDGLSLLDQAIAYGNGQVTTAEVKILLGATEPELLLELLQALANRDAAQILANIAQLADAGIDFQKALEEMLSLLHQITLNQVVPELPIAFEYLATQITALAHCFKPETTQLYYQMALLGRRDLPLAPTARSGFEMLLLRMLAFSPQPSSENGGSVAASKPAKITANIPPRPALATQLNPSDKTLTGSTPTIPNPPLLKENNLTQSKIEPPQVGQSLPKSSSDEHNLSTLTATALSWAELLPSLNLHGAALMVATHCTLVRQTATEIELLLDTQQTPLLNKAIELRIANALEQHFGQPLQLHMTIGQSTQPNPALLNQQREQKLQAEAVLTIASDPNVQNLVNEFGAQLIHDSVKPKSKK